MAIYDDERVRKRGGSSVYEQTAREKTPKIIPAREEINLWIPGCAGREEATRQERQGGA